MRRPVPVIDIFAGPGGLSEGFSAARGADGDPTFNVVLSIEKEKDAHRTLKLRSFCRQFRGRLPEQYYQLLRNEISLEDLYETSPEEAVAADAIAWCTELGTEDVSVVDARISSALAYRPRQPWVLVGGPPCQAYSIIGRARNGAIEGYSLDRDKRHGLYREYLRILHKHRPVVFIMENVRGMISSRDRQGGVFTRVLADLHRPAEALGSARGKAGRDCQYELYPLSVPDARRYPHVEHTDFVVRAEEHGIPQRRHRVIIMGVRSDFCRSRPATLATVEPVFLKHVIGDLPPLRSGLTREPDSGGSWRTRIEDALGTTWFEELCATPNTTAICDQIRQAIHGLDLPASGRGQGFLQWNGRPDQYADWFAGNGEFGGVCHHTSRAHMSTDLHRYLFVSSFAAAHGRSPMLRDFPESLLPAHGSVSKAVKSRTSHFADRFRAQVADAPATTITSHISRDGHYYIHYDSSQCRSLTVREAARIQTFPDDYYFVGGRTSKYVQVGNAVPPMLAHQIAEVVTGVVQSQGGRRGGGSGRHVLPR